MEGLIVTDLGVSTSSNLAIERASGSFIARMDCDDIALPDRFLKQVNYLEAHPEIAVVGSTCYRMDYYHNTTGLFQAYAEDHQIKGCLCRKDTWTAIWHPTSMIRKEALLDVGLYNEELKNAHDKDLWIRMAIKGYRFANLQEPLVKKMDLFSRPHSEELIKIIKGIEI